MLIKPGLILFFGLLLTVIVSISTSRDRDLFLDGLIQIEARSLSSSLEVQLKDQFSALNRLALRTQEPDDEFVRDATQFVIDKPGYRAITFVDTDAIYRKISTNPKAINMIGRSFATNEIRKQYFEQIQQTRTQVVTSTINLQSDHVPGFFAMAPVFDEGQFQGAIIGVFRYEALIPEFAKNELKKFNLAIYEDDWPIYSSAEFDETQTSHMASESLIYDGIHWRLVITPRAEYLAPFKSNAPLYFLMGGILLSLLTAITVYYIELTGRNKIALEKTRHSLVSETLQLEKTQGELYSTAENFTHLIENIREVVLIVDIIDGRPKTIFYSPGYEKILGYPVDELYKNPNRWFEDVHPDDKQMVREIFADIYQESYGLEYRIIRTPDQQVRWIRARGSLIPGLNRIVGTIEDISDEVAARERKLELGNELLQTQKMEALGSLAGGIAHDFNNILAIILGNTELQRELVGDNPKLVKQLESISYATNRGAELVKEILTFSQQSNTEPEVIELDSTIKETIHVLKPGIPADVELQYINNIRNARMLADENQIKQVILNLCINAYQAMSAEPGFLNIVVSRNDSHSKMVRIEISDTGEGMEEGVKKRMFDPFFTTRKEKGNTGLGLSSTLGIVELHGGSIEVESSPGNGTRVTLRLPTTSLPISAKKSNKRHATKNAPLNIIFVDDEPDIADLYQQYFKKENFIVSTFKDTRDALAHFLATPDAFDVIVTDQTMPWMSGTDFAREVRKINSLIPIILVTGHTDAMTPEVATGLGITRFVYKPIQLEELSGIVVDCVNRSRSSIQSHPVN